MSSAVAVQIEQLLKSCDIKVYVLQSAHASLRCVSISPVILVRRQDLRRARAIVKQAFKEAARRVPPKSPQPEKVLPFDWDGWLTIALIPAFVLAGMLFQVWPWLMALPIAIFCAKFIVKCIHIRSSARFEWI